MTKDAATKNFDCVKFMRQARDRISAEIADMSPEEVIERFNSRRYADPWSPDSSEPVRKLAKNAAAPKRRA